MILDYYELVAVYIWGVIILFIPLQFLEMQVLKFLKSKMDSLEERGRIIKSCGAAPPLTKFESLLSQKNYLFWEKVVIWSFLVAWVVWPWSLFQCLIYFLILKPALWIIRLFK